MTVGAGSSLGKVGTTFASTWSAGFVPKESKHLAVMGEFGILRRAPFEKADMVFTHLPADLEPASDFRVNGYHVNANILAQPVMRGRWLPDITAGFGSFIATPVAIRKGTLLPERRRETDFGHKPGRRAHSPVDEPGRGER